MQFISDVQEQAKAIMEKSTELIRKKIDLTTIMNTLTFYDIRSERYVTSCGTENYMLLKIKYMYYILYY